MIIKDFNAILIQGPDENNIRATGLGTRNNRGNALVELCLENRSENPF